VAKNAVPAAEAIAGCMVMVVVVVAVGTPTVTDVLNGHPEAGDCLIGWEGNLKNSESPDGGLSSQQANIPDGVAITGICIPAGVKSEEVTTCSVSS